jgi:hypothetical protein
LECLPNLYNHFSILLIELLEDSELFYLSLLEFFWFFLRLFLTFWLIFEKLMLIWNTFFGTFCLIPKCLFWKLEIVVNSFSAFSLRSWVLISYIYFYSVDLNVIELNFFGNFVDQIHHFFWNSNFQNFQISKLDFWKTFA